MTAASGEELSFATWMDYLMNVEINSEEAECVSWLLFLFFEVAFKFVECLQRPCGGPDGLCDVSQMCDDSQFYDDGLCEVTHLYDGESVKPVQTTAEEEQF